MSGGWVYGLLQEKNGSLVLCEMYDMGKYGWGAADLDWKGARRDKKWIVKDIEGQLRTRTEFHVMPGNKINVKRKGRWSKRKVVPFDPSKEKWISHDEVMADLFTKKKNRAKS